MTEVVTVSAAKNKVVLPGQAGDTMSAPEGTTTAASNNNMPPQTEDPKEVTWHDQHGMDLTQVREFEPRCVTAVVIPPPTFP